MTKSHKAKKNDIPPPPLIIQPIRESVPPSDFESLSKFLDSNRDDPLHNSIYFCLKNASLISTDNYQGDQYEIIFNIVKIPRDQQDMILKMFKERLQDIKLRKQIELDMVRH